MDQPRKLKIGAWLLSALLAAVAALTAFGWLAEEVIEGDTQQFDTLVRIAVHRLAMPELTGLMKGVSFLGSVAVVATLVMLSVGVCIYYRRMRAAVSLAVTMLGAGALDLVSKHVFHRPRPVAFWGSVPSSYSFPSGHALGAICFYGILAAILTARVRSRSAQVAIWSGAALLVGLIGFSRIYLGVHYPSDVAGGYCAGAVWVAAVAFADRALMATQPEGVDQTEEPSKQGRESK